MKRFLLLMITVLVLAACSSPYNDLLKEGNEAFDDGEYSQAKKLYEFALDEDPDGDEAKDKIALIESYNELGSLQSNSEDWEDAFELANKILKNDEINEAMKKDTKEKLTEIEENMEKEEKALTALEDVRKEIKNKKLDKAEKALNDFNSDIESSKVYNLHDEVYEELNEAMYAHEEEEREKEEKEAEKKRKAEAEKAAASGNKYDKYIAKADAIDQDMMDAAQEEGYIHDYAMVSHKFVDEWDGLLNEVWKELKSDLDSNQFKSLQEDQREWIKEKEAAYENNSDKQDAKADLGFTTMNRTFYLIENYMD